MSEKYYNSLVDYLKYSKKIERMHLTIRFINYFAIKNGMLSRNMPIFWNDFADILNEEDFNEKDKINHMATLMKYIDDGCQKNGKFRLGPWEISFIPNITFSCSHCRLIWFAENENMGKCIGCGDTNTKNCDDIFTISHYNHKGKYGICEDIKSMR